MWKDNFMCRFLTGITTLLIASGIILLFTTGRFKQPPFSKGVKIMNEEIMNEKTHCPNCGSMAEKSGNKITCVVCDAIFEIKKTGAASVVKLGEVEELKVRISALEALFSQEPEPEDFSDEVEVAEVADEAEEDILPR